MTYFDFLKVEIYLHLGVIPVPVSINDFSKKGRKNNADKFGVGSNYKRLRMVNTRFSKFLNKIFESKFKSHVENAMLESY